MSRKEKLLVSSILFMSAVIQIWMLHTMPISISNDSYGYLNLARNIGNEFVSFERSVGYPLFLALSGVHIFDSMILVIYLQSLMAIFLPLITYLTLRPVGVTYGSVGAFFMLTCLFTYHMSTQILTELPFMFSLALLAHSLSRYFFDTSSTLRWKFNAFYVVFCLVLIAVIRLSSSVQFLCFFVGAVTFIISLRISEKKWSVTSIYAFSLVSILFVGLNTLNNAVTDRTSSVVAPHFMFNWVYRSGTSIHYGIVKPENGPVTEEMYQKLHSAITNTPHLYKQLANGATSEIKDIANSKQNFTPDDIELLMDDLKYNTGHSLRSWWIEGALINRFGVPEASRLMGGAIKEAFLNNPEFIIVRALTSLERLKNFVVKGVNPSPVLLPSSYFHMIPFEGNFKPSISSGMFAEWLFGLHSQIGYNETWKESLGGYPVEYHVAVAARDLDSNIIAFGHYLVLTSLQLMRLVWAAIIFGAVFVLWSRNLGFAISTLLAATVPPMLSVFISETDSRHIIMSFPMQVVASLVCLSGLVELVKTRLLSNEFKRQFQISSSYKRGEIARSSQFYSLNEMLGVVMALFAVLKDNWWKIFSRLVAVFLALFLTLQITNFAVSRFTAKTSASYGEAANITRVWPTAHGVELGSVDKKLGTVDVLELQTPGEHFLGSKQFNLKNNSSIEVTASIVNSLFSNVDSVLIYLITDDFALSQRFDITDQIVGPKTKNHNVTVEMARLAYRGNTVEIAAKFLVGNQKCLFFCAPNFWDTGKKATLRIQLLGQNGAQAFSGSGNRSLKIENSQITVINN